MNYLVNNRIPSLDGLRTISVLFVVTSHFLYTIGYDDAWNLGILGVKFFFVISGFLITGLLLKELAKTSTINLGKFYFRRTLRIFPPYYFYLLVLFFAVKFGVVPDISNDSFIAPITYTTNYFASNSWNLLHTWSLSVEEQFYLIYPFVLIFFGRHKIVWLLGGLIVLCPFLRLADYHFFSESQKMWIYYGFHANADGLATGCLLAIFYEKLHQNRFYLKILNSYFVILAPVLLLFINSTIDPRQFYLGAAFTLSNFLVLICLDWAITNYDNNLLGKFLNSAPMTQIGVMSYSIYMWQQPFLNHDNPRWFNYFPYNLIGIALFSSLSYFLIEKVSLKWRGKVEKRIFATVKKD
jgi:peptidoglycan/LPS O-acetylase OafA/YrhL